MSLRLLAPSGPHHPGFPLAKILLCRTGSWGPLGANRNWVGSKEETPWKS